MIKKNFLGLSGISKSLTLSNRMYGENLKEIKSTAICNTVLSPSQAFCVLGIIILFVCLQCKSCRSPPSLADPALGSMATMTSRLASGKLSPTCLHPSTSKSSAIPACPACSLMLTSTGCACWLVSTSSIVLDTRHWVWHQCLHSLCQDRRQSDKHKEGGKEKKKQKEERIKRENQQKTKTG